MATPYDAIIASAQAALDKLSDLETAAMKNGDLATVNALQSDSDNLTLKLTQLRALAVDDDDQQIDAINKQLDTVTANANAALADLSQMTTVLTAILIATKLLDSIISAIPK
jgi:hypothetical protein